MRQPDLFLTAEHGSVYGTPLAEFRITRFDAKCERSTVAYGERGTFIKNIIFSLGLT